MKPDSSFRREVEQLVAALPADRVTTYGDLAALAGHPYAARVVGGIAHFGPRELPWHRVVNRFGGLARGFPGGMEAQRQLLMQDGITCTDYVIDDFDLIRWRPL